MERKLQLMGVKLKEIFLGLRVFSWEMKDEEVVALSLRVGRRSP